MEYGVPNRVLLGFTPTVSLKSFRSGIIYSRAGVCCVCVRKDMGCEFQIISFSDMVVGDTRTIVLLRN